MTAKSARKATARKAPEFAPSLPPFGDRRRRRVGLLGGSFNPAHEGHLHLTQEALRRLGLDQVWWLVSPQNPLKPARGMAPVAARLAGARTQAKDRRIVVTDVERRLGSAYTARVIGRLRARYPNVQFVWLMGADNLGQISRWWRWGEIFRGVRVAVFDRSPYSYEALAGAAAKRFWAHRRNHKTLWAGIPPAWSYIAMRRHPASGTALRAGSAKARR